MAGFVFGIAWPEAKNPRPGGGFFVSLFFLLQTINKALKAARNMVFSVFLTSLRKFFWKKRKKIWRFGSGVFTFVEQNRNKKHQKFKAMQNINLNDAFQYLKSKDAKNNGRICIDGAVYQIAVSKGRRMAERFEETERLLNQPKRIRGNIGYYDRVTGFTHVVADYGKKLKVQTVLSYPSESYLMSSGKKTANIWAVYEEGKK